MPPLEQVDPKPYYLCLHHVHLQNKRIFLIVNVCMADKKCKPSGTCRPLPAHSEALVGTAELDLVLKAFSQKKASALSWELFGHCTS